MSKISHNQVKELGLHEGWDSSHPDYKIGDLTTENNKIWICVKDHIPSNANDINGSPTQANQNSWEIASGNIEGMEWQPNVDYKTGDVISEGNRTFTCSRNHTSLISDNPDGSPSQPSALSWDYALVHTNPEAALIGNEVKNIVWCTRPEYDSITPVDDTYYIIVASPIAPPAVTDFNASDNEYNQIRFSWTNVSAVPAPVYNLYDTNGIVQNNITSPFVLSITGTETYYIKAINSEGESTSNSDDGTGVVVVLKITDFNATDGLADTITTTFTEQ